MGWGHIMNEWMNEWMLGVIVAKIRLLRNGRDKTVRDLPTRPSRRPFPCFCFHLLLLLLPPLLVALSLYMTVCVCGCVYKRRRIWRVAPWFNLRASEISRPEESLLPLVTSSSHNFMCRFVTFMPPADDFFSILFPLASIFSRPGLSKEKQRPFSFFFFGDSRAKWLMTQVALFSSRTSA